MTPERIKTLYLLPHSHTDIGYTHDPLVVWELHDRFLDRAIELCESTATLPADARFHWTIEVFATLEHWWQQRPAAWHERLLSLMRDGRIDVGARRFNGTCLSTPADIRWEQDRVSAFAAQHQVTIRNAFNNDVNGFSLAYAQDMASRGVDGLMMGLNTTMGASPLPRPNAWRWQMPDGREVLTCNGLIYNRLKCTVKLPTLADSLPARQEELFRFFPADYPFDFAAFSAVVDDNTGPIAELPEQVRQFNAAGHGLRLVITTLSGFMARLRAESARLPVYTGDWTDAWSFYLGSFPQEVAALRRAQRRLALVDGIRRRGWANVDGGTLTMDRARAEIASASEHTYGSHSSCGEPESADTQRQWAQIRASFWNAESLAMGLLRDHLASVVARQSPAPQPGVLCVNPSDDALPLRALYEASGFKRFADPTRPEHLYQFDREPTRNAFTQTANFGTADARIPAGGIQRLPAGPITVQRQSTELPADRSATLQNGALALTLDPARQGAVSLRTLSDGREWVAPDAEFALFAPVRELLVHPAGFQLAVPGEVRDPSDCAWARELRFQRELRGRCTRVERLTGPDGEAVRLHLADSIVRTLEFRLDPLQPDTLDLRATGWLAADCARQAWYFAFDLDLGTQGAPTRFMHDSCGLWLEAGKDQLPGTCTSHYAAWRGVALDRGGACAYLAARDTVLWQFGRFSFGPPQAPLHRERAFAAAWLYNNYWFCNVPACSPGGFDVHYRLRLSSAPFTAGTANALYARYQADIATHPLRGLQT